jgi:glycosyltransferase involved in cell wall biosynthesis
MSRPPISVLILTKDEEAALPACLDSVAWAEERVVVDSLSTDRTREIALARGARVLTRPFDDYSAQKNWALPQLAHPWTLWLDADERVDAPLAAAIAALPAEPPLDGYRVARRNHFLGRRIAHCGWQGETVLRLFRRDGARFVGAVHETLEGPVRTALLPGALDHHPYPTWDHATDKLVRYAAMNARKAYDAGRRAGPWSMIVRPPVRFLRMYVAQGGFLDGAHGAALCGLAAAQVFLKYARLWDATRRGDAAFAPRGEGA